jgi:hypothetical protein
VKADLPFRGGSTCVIAGDTVRKIHVRIACETYTDFVHLPLGPAAHDEPRSHCAHHR